MIISGNYNYHVGQTKALAVIFDSQHTRRARDESVTHISVLAFYKYTFFSTLYSTKEESSSIEIQARGFMTRSI
jgi:hypothetical protein